MADNVIVPLSFSFSFRRPWHYYPFEFGEECMYMSAKTWLIGKTNSKSCTIDYVICQL